jgi:riboflavin synthase
MFTGIIEALGAVESIQRVELSQGPVVRLVVVTDLDVETLPIGASIAVDGVSLTVNTVVGNVFSVTLIPHTLEVTKLGDKRVGDTVNLEADMIVKHIDRLMAAQFGGDRSASHTPRREISIDTLRRYGFVR